MKHFGEDPRKTMVYSFLERVLTFFFLNKTYQSFWKGFYFILDLTFCGDFWIENFLLIELDHVSLIMLKHISGHYKQKTWNQAWDGTGHLSHKFCPDPACNSEFQRFSVPESMSRDTNPGATAHLFCKRCLIFMNLYHRNNKISRTFYVFTIRFPKFRVLDS